MTEEKKLLYEELSYEVIGCAFEAFKAIGIGFDEIMYHQVFHRFLLRKGLDAKYKVPVQLDYLGEKIANLEAGEIIGDKIVVELKSIQTEFLPENYAQIMTYLKITGLRLGLLINFGLHQAFPKRIIFDEQRIENAESWDEGYFQDPAIKTIVDATVASIYRVDAALGATYHSKIYQAALITEFKQEQITQDDKVRINVKVEDLEFKPFEIDYWLVEKSLLLGVLAGKDKPRAYDLLRMRSYLRRLNLNHGLIAFWSTKNLQLYGIYEQRPRKMNCHRNDS